MIKSKLIPYISNQDIKKQIDIFIPYINKVCDSNTHILIILKGAFFFANDLLIKINSYKSINFLQLSSYLNNKSTGLIKANTFPIEKDPTANILIIEDIVDTGLTLQYLKKELEGSFNRIYTCTLLNKPDARLVNIEPEYTLFNINRDTFVVGYGMDYNEQYRTLPHIYILE